jgi:integrase/recombinase XerD
MPHDRSALIEQLRAHLTQQQFNSVVSHSYCRNAEHFLEHQARQDIA